MAIDQELRPRYYEDQYLGADDLDQAVLYGRLQQARHALGAHTWGISLGLDLVEKPRPGGGNRVDVFLTPGYAWDGYARPIVALAPAALPESLFADISFDPQNPDDRDGKGRLVPVWLQYEQQSLRPPPRGFETCREGNHDSRIHETFRFIVGRFGRLAQHGSVVINSAEIDPTEALSRFESFATPQGTPTNVRTLWDESVPHQEYPGEDPLPRWLIPIGSVRWLPSPSGPGQFVKRDDSGPTPQDPLKQPDSDIIRAQRRYAGVVAESIEGAGGVLRLRNRFRDPGSVSFRPPRITTDPTKPPENEVVWVEGDLRVVGDARLAGGKLAFRIADGKDEDRPLEFRRDVHSQGGRTLQTIIGNDTQDNNRFAVGRLMPGQSLDQKLVVTSAGNVGIGTDVPTQRLTIKSPFDTLLEITPTSASLPWQTDGTINEGAFVINQQSAGSQKPDADFALMRDRKQRVSLGDTDTFISSQDRNTVKGQVHFFLNRAEAGEREVMRITDRANVGIGTVTPSGRLSIQGEFPEHGILNIFSLASDFEYDGGSDKVFLFRHLHADGKTGFLGGNVGIGTANPTERLEVNGNLKVTGLINGHDIDAELNALAPGGAVTDVSIVQGEVAHGGNIWFGVGTGKVNEERIVSLKQVSLPGAVPGAWYEIQCFMDPISGPILPGQVRGRVTVKCVQKITIGTVDIQLAENPGVASYTVIGWDK